MYECMVMYAHMLKTKTSRAMSDGALALVAAQFKVLSEPNRLKLLAALHDGELNVTQLVEVTGATQANVSKHLGILMDAGMVSRRKEGLNVYYMISDPTIFQLCDLMCSKLEKEFAEKTAHFR